MKVKSLLFFLLLVCVSASALAQSGQGAVVTQRMSYPMELTQTERNGSREEMILREIVRAPGATWLRLHLSKYSLGEKSYLILTSLKDKGQQRLDARTLPEWSNATAFFNGDAVEVELRVAPGEEGIFIRMAELTFGQWQEPGRKGVPVQKTLCGPDNRIRVDDRRVGRVNVQNAPGATSNAFCTVWLVSNGALLTAGHCVDFDANGVVDAGFSNGVIEFNVPSSQNNSATVFADPNDQYPINVASIRWRFDGSGRGLGKDWAVFACNANPNTRLLPHQRQGDSFRMTNVAPEPDAFLRVTGYGLDTGDQNQTLQSSIGPYRGQRSANNNADIWHTYQVDTQGHNSGSPIIWDTWGAAIGIHTDGGCNADGTGANVGTSFEHDPLENALQNFIGPNAVYVDNFHPSATKDGSIFRPVSTVLDGVTIAGDHGTVSIRGGVYGDRITISKPVTLRAPAGAVTIGQ